MEGSIKVYLDYKGFGFIQVKDTKAEYFFSITQVEDETYLPQKGDVVSFDPASGPKGLYATHVVYLRPPEPRVRKPQTPAEEVSRW